MGYAVKVDAASAALWCACPGIKYIYTVSNIVIDNIISKLRVAQWVSCNH